MTTPPTGATSSADAADGYEALFLDAPCGYLTTDDDGCITRVNDTFLAWTGHTREGLVGSSFGRLLPVGDRLLMATHAMPRLVTDGHLAELMVEVVAADRSRRPALLSASRRPPSPGREAELRVVVLSAHERRAYEGRVVATLQQAETAEQRRAEAEHEVRQLETHDQLTGLLNRDHLRERLDALVTASPGGAPVVALLVDLDHFSSVNDSLGHAAGDQLLVEVSRRLRSVVRSGAVLARLGADEFLVADTLAPVADSGPPALALAARVARALEDPLLVDDVEVVVSASIGVCAGRPGDVDGAGLLRGADLARHRVKARGRDGIALHVPEEQVVAVDHLRLLGELRRGIQEGQLRLHYQPLVHLDGRASTAVEALVRWQHPERGLLPPGVFIEAAERSGLVHALGRWVLDAALAQVAVWDRTEGLGRVQVSVNLSTRQLTDPSLPADVGTALRRHGVDPGQLVLEVTETALMVDPDAARTTLLALRELGVGIAVDDFGTGYASLTYLQQFPVDELKIDRSFVAGLGRSDADDAIVASCVQLAHGLGLSAVAEGVEGAGQLEALRRLGCDYVQGYHLGRPMPPEDLVAWVADRAGLLQRLGASPAPAP
ncbi:putative bifunctional diguanylate cyclase/phosphodiesterase [Aquipuribacter hungaricus]|uniref:Bifunctional diguanylate cyclase/phosphodiesterase n=1 Tax=Aquipuribacter hungaricus TaxID=545624 RepID=A0ABV7WBV7_9MICO